MIENYKKLFSYILCAFILCVIVIFLFPKAWHLLWPFVIGWLIAMIANPIVRFLENKLRLKRKHGSILIIIGVLLFIIAIIYGLIFVVINLGQDIVHEFPDMLTHFESVLIRVTDTVESIIGYKKLDIDSVNSLITEKMQDIVSVISEKGVSYIGSLLSDIPSLLMGSLFAIISSFFFIRDKYKIEEYAKKVLKKWNLHRLALVKDSCIHVFKHYIEAQLKISAIIYVILLIGMLILNVSYAPLIAFCITIVDLLPIFGTGTILWPWIVIDLLLGKYNMAIGLVILYVIALVMRQVIQPKILSDSMGLSPLASLVLMYVGFQIGGFLGLLLAVPIGMVVYELYQKGLFDEFFDLLLKIKQKNNVQ